MFRHPLRIRMRRTGGVLLPTKAYNEKQAGWDFYLPEDLIMHSNTKAIIELNIAWQPYYKGLLGYIWSKFFTPYLQFKSKSGLAFKSGIEVTNAGVIDFDYRDSMKMLIYNRSNMTVQFKKGDKICQGVIIELPIVHKIEEVIEFKEEKQQSHRGNRGFGSSGK